MEPDRAEIISVLEQFAQQKNLQWQLNYGPTHINGHLNDGELAQLQYKLAGNKGKFLLLTQALHSSAELKVPEDKRLTIVRQKGISPIEELGALVTLETYPTMELYCEDPNLYGSGMFDEVVAQIILDADGTIHPNVRRPEHAEALDPFEGTKDIRGIAAYLFDYISK